MPWNPLFSMAVQKDKPDREKMEGDKRTLRKGPSPEREADGGLFFTPNWRRRNKCYSFGRGKGVTLPYLNEIKKKTMQQEQFLTWPMDLLIDYIQKFHHRGIRQKGAAIVEDLRKFTELQEVAALFEESLEDLDNHCEKEDQVLYPYLCQLSDAEREGFPLPAFHCGSVQFPINVMIHEHDGEQERYVRIRQLTDDYTAPAEAADVLARLADFQRLHIDEHIALENEILFPMALRYEAQLAV